MAQLQISYNSHQSARRNVLNLKKLEVVKTQKLSKLKVFTSWDRNFVHPLTIFGRENLSNPRLCHTVRVASKLLMDPTNVIASDPQV